MISAHMLVKDDLDYIGASIGSIHDVVDEIVLVDNGSGPEALDIINSFSKVRVIHDPRNWKEVGEHNIRNAGLAECRGDFIWIWDSDEVLYEGQRDAILGCLDNDSVGCWRFYQYEFFGDHYHVQDQYRGPDLDGAGEIVPGFGRQVIHGHPIIYRNHPGLRYVENTRMKYGLHSSIRGTQEPNSEYFCEHIKYAHYGSCKSNAHLYGKTMFYYDAVIDPDDPCHTIYKDIIDPDNPLGYHPDQAVRSFFGEHPIYMKDNPAVFHRITKAIDDGGKARIVARSDTPVEILMRLGTPAQCGRASCNYDPPVVDVNLRRAANEYTVIKALDYYTATTELCMIHPNVFVMVNENVPDNPQFSADTRSHIRDIIYPNARHFVAVSESVRDALLVDGVPPRKISVINFWGCDTGFWRPILYDAATADEVRATFNPGISRNMILFVGRMVDHKGIGYLLDTLKYLPPDTCIVLVGGEGDPGKWIEPLPPKIQRRVFYLGSRGRDDLLKLYNLAKVVVLPSIPTSTWVEQFGRVLTEAMSTCTPCIATDVGGPRDIVAHRSTGLLIRPADTVELARAVTHIIGNPDEALLMGIAGRYRCCKYFSDDVCNDKFMKCIKENMV